MAAKKYTWQDTLKDMKREMFHHYVEHHKDNPQYKRYVKWLIVAVCILIFVPILLFPFMIAFEWPKQVKLIIVLVWILFPGITFTYGAFRNRRIKKMILSIPMGEEKVEVVHLVKPEELDFIYETNGITYKLLQEPDGEFCNILYNWYHNMGVLRDNKLILYVTDAAMFAEKFQVDVITQVWPKVVGVFCKDLDVESEEDFAKKAKYGIKLDLLKAAHPEDKGENKENG